MGKDILQKMYNLYNRSCQKTKVWTDKGRDKALMTYVTIDTLLGNPSMAAEAELTPEQGTDGLSMADTMLFLGAPLILSLYLPYNRYNKLAKKNPDNVWVAENLGIIKGAMIIGGGMTAMGVVAKFAPKISNFIDYVCKYFS